jgi:hypothetical protein
MFLPSLPSRTCHISESIEDFAQLKINDLGSFCLLWVTNYQNAKDPNDFICHTRMSFGDHCRVELVFNEASLRSSPLDALAGLRIQKVADSMSIWSTDMPII